MDLDLIAISTAFVAIIAAMFAGFLKLQQETRKVLNGASEKRAVTASERHGEIQHELKSMTTCMRSFNTTGKEQNKLLRELIDK